jgi:hypothetical protein
MIAIQEIAGIAPYRLRARAAARLSTGTTGLRAGTATGLRAGTDTGIGWLSTRTTGLRRTATLAGVVLCTLVLDCSTKCAAVSFAPHDITTSAIGATSVFAIDVDGDGDMDVLSASLYDDTIAWYENDNQVFTKRDITTAADGAISVYAIDVDGDRDMDVLSA